MRLACRDLAWHFGGVHAVDGVDLEVAGGSCVAVVGGNGSGKSTLLDLMSGLRNPTRGTVEVGGEVLAGPGGAGGAGKAGPQVFAARGVRRTFQEPRLVADLSVAENVGLGLIGRLSPVMGLPRSPRALEHREVPAALEAVGLGVAGRQAVTTLSYGQRKRAELARVLVSAPRVALLDEPLAGVALDDRPALLAAVAAMVAVGAAVVLVEHDATAVEAVANRVVVLERGRVAEVST